MIRPRWKKVFADLTSNLVRSLLVVVSIAIGLIAVGMIVILYNAIGSDMRVGYLAVNAANIQVSSEPIPDDFVDHLNGVSGIEDAEGLRFLNLQIRTNPRTVQSH